MPASSNSPTAKRKIAIQRMCLGPDGKLTNDAKAVLSYLRKECNGTGGEAFPRSPITGQVDPIEMARRAGRREVFDMLVRMLTITLEQRQNLEE